MLKYLNGNHQSMLPILWCIYTLVLCLFSPVVNATGNSDIFEMPLEQLLNMEVYSASKFNQKKSDAPTAVTVITAQDIKDYGYRTLGDILQSVRGVYINNDRNYQYAGTRGFSIPGDLNTHVLVLLDGYRLNDSIFDQGPMGTEFPVDVDLIERVEYVPGAGSAIYGNNAFFGVINVITKSGNNFKGNGLEISGRVASYGTDQERFSYGKHFDNGMELLLSGTRFDSKGENHLTFPDLAGQQTTTNNIFDYGQRLFGKFSWQHFTLETGYSRRNKGLPTGVSGSIFDDPRNQNIDQHAFFNLSYDNLIADNLQLYARAYHGRYDYPYESMNNIPYISSQPILVQQTGLARWWGTEIRFTSTHIDGHKLMLGAEYQDNFELTSELAATIPKLGRQSSLTERSNFRYNVYVQDEITLADNLILNAGLRYDQFSYTNDAVNPRLALIYKPWQNTAFKFIYGSSFRAPNPFELYFNDPSQIANLGLKPEKIKTYEGIIEYQPDNTLRLTAVGFHYEAENLIQLQAVNNRNQTVKFVNSDINEAWGAEFEAEKLWSYGGRLRASYTWVNANDDNTGRRLINSPTSLFKLNFSTPLWDNRFRLGAEAQYTSSRMGRDNVLSDGYPLFNLSLTSGPKLFDSYLKGLEISGSIYNLFDENYDNVAKDDYVQHLFPQNGRNLRLVFNYRY